MVAQGDRRKAAEVDRENAAHWIIYARRRDCERWETINLANRIFNVPREQWARMPATR